jgi:opacity protein-like surface antigen
MRSFLLSGACAGAMLLALLPGAQAGDFDFEPLPQASSWYVSVFGGLSLGESADFDGRAVSGTDAATIAAEADIEEGLFAGLAAGLRFNDWIRAEAEVSGHWHDAGGYATTVLNGGYYTSLGLEGEVNALFVLGNLWIELPFEGEMRPYIGGGAGFGRLEADLSTTVIGYGTAGVEDADWAFAYQLGGGVAYEVTPSMAVDLGYRYKRIDNARLGAEAAATPLETELDYKSHNFLLGLRLSL